MNEQKPFSVIVPQSQIAELKRVGDQSGIIFGSELLHMLVVNETPPIQFLRILGEGTQGMITQFTEALVEIPSLAQSATVYEGQYQQREDRPVWLNGHTG